MPSENRGRSRKGGAVETPMFPFKRDAVVWHPKGNSRDGARSADDVRALGAGNPLVTGSWWWNHRWQDRHNPPPGTFFTTEQVLNGHYVGDPNDEDNENYPSALARQNVLLAHPQQQDDHLQQEDPGMGQAAGPGRARRIDVRSSDRIWRKIGDTMAHRVYSAWEIADTQHSPSTRGDRWTMEGDDSNTPFSSKDIRGSVFKDTEPWILSRAIGDWPRLLRVQYEIQEERRAAEQSRRDEALNAARERLRDVDRRSELCRDYDGWGRLTARTIDQNANIWKRAGEPDAPSTNAANIARGYLRHRIDGRELWHIGYSPSRCHSTQRIAEAVFSNTDGESLGKYLRRTEGAGAAGAIQGGSRGGSYNNDDDNDDPSPNDLRFNFDSTTPWWYRTWRGAAAYVGRNAKSAQGILNGLNANGSVWVKRAEDDEGEHKDPPGQQYSAAELGNAIFADTGGQTLSDFLQRGQAGQPRPGPKRKSRKQRKHARKPKTRKPRKHARKPKTHRRRKHKGRHGTKRR